MRVFITGANGQLGRELVDVLLKCNIEVIAASHEDLDVKDAACVQSAILHTDIDAFINCAAITNVDYCEDNQEEAFLVNGKATRAMAIACNKMRIPLIHISTDYVFTENGRGPHLETDRPTPNGAYAKTKYQGELNIIENTRRYIIIRTAWLFSKYGNNFVKKICHFAKTQDEINVVSNNFGNPTPAKALAYAIAYMLPKILDDDFSAFGIYHYTSCEITSWDKFAMAILKKASELGYLQRDVRIKSIPSYSLKQKAPRPLDSSLDCSLFLNTFEISIPSYLSYLDEVVSEAFASFKD